MGQKKIKNLLQISMKQFASALVVATAAA